MKVSSGLSTDLTQCMRLPKSAAQYLRFLRLVSAVHREVDAGSYDNKTLKLIGE